MKSTLGSVVPLAMFLSTTHREVLEEQITPIVLYIEEQAKDQNEKHGTSKDECIVLKKKKFLV